MTATAQRGAFLVFEGPEGAGKSTQIRRLAEALGRRGVATVVTREPGGTPAGDAIRAVLLDAGLRIDPLAEFLLYSANRAQHVEELIRPALERGDVVLSDRFSAASVAYQGYGRGLDLAFVDALNARVSAGVRPDLTVLLDIEPEQGLDRIGARGARDRLERAGLAFHRRVRQGFLAQAAREPGWLVIDAGQDLDTVTALVWDAVAARLGVARTG